MGIDDWELIDCHDDHEKTHRSDDLKIDSTLNHTDQSVISVSQDSGQKLIGDVEEESGTAAELDRDEEEGGNVDSEKKKQWGRRAVCSFGIAVAASICSVLLGSHSHHGTTNGACACG